MNNPQRLVDRFMAISSTAQTQADADTPVADAVLDARYRVEIAQQEVVLRREKRDCRNEFLIGETLRTRGLRFTLTYTEVTPQLIAIWTALHMGAQAGPTGTPADEVQTVTVAGDGTLSLTLEGRTVTTRTIESTGVTAQIIEDALTASHMLFIQPGDVAVSGAGPFTVTFPNTGRLGRANLPIMVGGGGFSVAAGTDGANNEFDLTFSTSRVKQRFGFVLGWENVTDRFEKYNGFVVESVALNLERRNDVGMTVTIFGPWQPEILTSFAVPACINPDSLLTEDCRVLIDSIWETLDINTLGLTLNDSVPVDESAAYGWDSPDVQDLERGDQPQFDMTGSVFASEVDNIYDKAANERTEDPVPIILHLGMPGDRVTFNIDYGKLKFADNRWGTAGTLNKSTVNFVATPYRLDSNFPVEAEAALDQATAFLLVSP
jgi:hypothetical protein